MSMAEAVGLPCARIAAVTAAACLGVIEEHLVTLVAGEREAVIAQDTGLVPLALLAYPHNVVLAELVLADLPGPFVPQFLQRV